MGLIATLLGVLTVVTPVPVEVCDVRGCRVQGTNAFGPACGVSLHGSIRATSATRATWRVTAHRRDGLLTRATFVRDVGAPHLWAGTQAYYTVALTRDALAAGAVLVHVEDSTGCQSDTQITLGAAS